LDGTLHAGLSGISLFFAYLDRLLPGSGYASITSELLDRSIDRASELESPAGLYPGIAGVAWVLEHLSMDYADLEQDLGENVAEGFNEHLSRSPWMRDYDLMVGVVGYGAYALERQPKKWGKACLESVVARLSEAAESTNTGITWRTSPDWLAQNRRAEFPDGNYNLGMAHGVPGVIALLSAVYAAGVAQGAAERLVEGAVQWLLSQQLPPGGNSMFPPVVAPASKPISSRLAWCYGDLGVAISLLVASQALGRPEWQLKACEIGRHAANRAKETTGIVDCGLCHGSIGVAHLFNRLFHACREPLFESTAILWLRYTLEQRKPGHGVGGFLTFGPDKRGSLCWQRDPGFLTGAVGIGLGLIASVSSIEPEWDRLLLASTRHDKILHPLSQ
jgi:lantibiotic modifying enzyme